MSRKTVKDSGVTALLVGIERKGNETDKREGFLRGMEVGRKRVLRGV